MDKTVLTARDVKKLYNISRSALVLWEKMGLLHPFKTPGGQRRYFREELEDLLQIKKFKPRKRRKKYEKTNS